MRYFENLEINVDILSVGLLNLTIYKMERYNISALESFTEIANALYVFSKKRNQITATRQNYIERIFKVITEKSFNFSDSELNAMYRWLHGISIITDIKTKDVEKQLKAEILEQNAYKQKLLDSTSEYRRLLKYSQFMLTSDILEYIEYWEKFEKQENCLGLFYFYNNLYFLGYIAGKRAERARKNC